MYCEKCGNKLSEMSKFCENCGSKVDGEVVEEKVLSNINRDEVLLEIRPTTKMSYFILPNTIGVIIAILVLIGMFLFMSTTMPDPETNRMMMLIVLGLSALIGVVWLGGIGISALFTKKQNQNRVYTFYPDRLVYKDSFLDKSQEEIKYKYVREISNSQTMTQRIFKVGSVRISSNAEGYSSGIVINDIEEVDKHYRAIKEIINI